LNIGDAHHLWTYWITLCSCRKSVLRFFRHLPQPHHPPVRREGADFALLQLHLFALRHGDGAVGEQVLHQALLQFLERGDDPLRRLFRPLHRPQHVSNGALLGERGEGDGKNG